jgi:hypothetical protein
MSNLLPRVQLTIVQRLMREYYNEIMFNVELYEAKDITLKELEDMSMAIDERYSIKIFKAVLE